MDKLNEQQSAKLASLSVKQQTSAADIQRIALELHLRQWCVEQANHFCEHAMTLYGESSQIGPYTLSSAAQAVFDFVAAPMREQQ